MSIAAIHPTSPVSPEEASPHGHGQPDARSSGRDAEHPAHHPGHAAVSPPSPVSPPAVDTVV